MGNNSDVIIASQWLKQHLPPSVTLVDMSNEADAAPWLVTLLVNLDGKRVSQAGVQLLTGLCEISTLRPLPEAKATGKALILPTKLQDWAIGEIGYQAD